MKIVITTLILSLLLFTPSSSQELNGTMTAESILPSDKLNPEVDKSLLIVQSEIRGLKFDSNLGIIKKNEVSSGYWEVWLLPSNHQIKIDAEGYERLELKRFSFGPKKTYSLRVKEVRAPRRSGVLAGKGSITLLTDPAGAEVSIDGLEGVIKTTPASFNNILANKWKVTFTKEKYDTLSADVIVYKDTTIQPPPFKLTPRFGFIRFQGFTTERMSIDGQPAEAGQLAEVEAGEHTVSLSQSGSAPLTKKIQVKPGETKIVSKDDFRETGILKISTDVDASILVNNKVIGKRSVSYSTYPGEYDVAIRHAMLGEISERVLVQPKEEFSLFRSMLPERPKARLYSVIPGASQIYKKQTLTGWTYVAAFTVSAAAFVLFQTEYSANNDAYSSAIAEYNNAQTAQDAAAKKALLNSRYDKTSTSLQMRNAAVISVGVTYLWSVIDAWIFDPALGYRGEQK